MPSTPPDPSGRHPRPRGWWGWTPHLSFTEFTQDPVRHVVQFLLPGAILGIASAAAIMRLTRAMLLANVVAMAEKQVSP